MKSPDSIDSYSEKIVNIIAQPICVVKLDGKIVYANAFFSSNIISSEKLLSEVTFHSIFPQAKDIALLRQHMVALSETMPHYFLPSMEVLTNDGRLFMKNIVS